MWKVKALGGKNDFSAGERKEGVQENVWIIVGWTELSTSDLTD